MWHCDPARISSAQEMQWSFTIASRTAPAYFTLWRYCNRCYACSAGISKLENTTKPHYSMSGRWSKFHTMEILHWASCLLCAYLWLRERGDASREHFVLIWLTSLHGDTTPWSFHWPQFKPHAWHLDGLAAISNACSCTPHDWSARLDSSFFIYLRKPTFLPFILLLLSIYPHHTLEILEYAEPLLLIPRSESSERGKIKKD